MGRNDLQRFAHIPQTIMASWDRQTGVTYTNTLYHHSIITQFRHCILSGTWLLYTCLPSWGSATGGRNQKCCTNSIAFGSAPRREVDSQPISQLDRPAVRQTETHTLGFLLVADTLWSSRDRFDFKHWWWPSGNACHRKLAGRRYDYLQRCRRCISQQTRIRTTGYKVCAGCVTIGPAAMLQQSASPLLEAC